MIRNPLVQRSMTMLRKLVNELRRNGTIDADTRIHIELARDVNSRNDRMAIQEWQKKNEKERADAKAKLQEHGIGEPPKTHPEIRSRQRTGGGSAPTPATFRLTAAARFFLVSILNTPCRVRARATIRRPIRHL
jgi:hypothetical protein